MPPFRSLLGAMYFAASVGLASVLGVLDAFAQAEPLNVVVIVADDAELLDLGRYGGNLPTPHLDRLADEGVRFTNAYATATVCTPSRFTLLTGQYPSASRTLTDATPDDTWPVLRWNTFIEEADVTIADRFNARGYHTAFIGKWHNGNPRQWHVPHGAPISSGEWQDELADNGQIRRDHVQQTAGFDEAAAIYTENVRWLPVPESAKGHQQHWMTSETHRVIREQAEADEPWFLFHATTLPHPPDTVASLKADPRITLLGLRDGHLDAQPSPQSVLARTEAHGPYHDVQPYDVPPGEFRASEAAGILWLDDAVGAIFAELEATGQLDETVIVFVSDHGRTGKFVLNEGRVPLIVRLPDGTRAGEVEDALVSLVDLPATLLDLTQSGRTIATSLPAAPWPSRSFAPLVRGEAESTRDAVFMEVTLTRAVVTPTHKYIATRFPPHVADRLTPELRQRINQEGRFASVDDPDGNVVRYRADTRFPGYFDDDQLYDLRADPGEQHNLADEPAHANTLADLQTRLDAHVRTTPFRFGEFGKPRD
ncbi:MAG: sulfatase-like hydrolase/transferase [Planctomycetota bacterium]